MRLTYRDKSTAAYWDRRWAQLPVDRPAGGADRYPLAHAERLVRDVDGPLLELGCGPGRLLRNYHQRGFDILGVDSVEEVVRKLDAYEPGLRAAHADARALPFEDARFGGVLCFGVFHSLENGVGKAIAETYRVLRPGGSLCAEFRADSLHNLIIDYYKGRGKTATEFHKCNFTIEDARAALVEAGFEVEAMVPAINMSVLYHLALLRHASQKSYDEHTCRADGYRLRPTIEAAQALALRWAPRQVANLFIFYCRKPQETQP